MKYIVIIGDGMSDYPVERLGGKTPLMVAKKGAIDRIACEGRCGRLVTVEPEMPPGSEVANLTVLGYDPKTCYQGRGVLEAASLGITLNDTDVAMRCNLISVEQGRIKNHSAGHISTEEARELIVTLNDRFGSDRVRFFPGFSYRHVLVLADASPDLECFPPHDNVGKPLEDVMVKARTQTAEGVADTLNAMIVRSRDILTDHAVNRKRRAEGKDEANYMWPWSPGRKPNMKTIQERYGLRGAVVSAVDLIKGTGIYAGMDILEVEGATGLWDTNYEGKADACMRALDDHDFVYCHVEATDEAGHARDLDLKIKSIEYLDGRLVDRILKRIEADNVEAVVAILPDHSTPVEYGNHVKDPVPVAIWDPRKAPDHVARFDEQSVSNGELGVLHGSEFIETVLDIRGKETQ